MYAVYVSGQYLDKYVDSNRTDFNIPKTSVNRSLDSERSLSIESIRNAVLAKSKEFLASNLEDLKERKKEIVDNFVISNPQLRAVQTYCPDVLNEFEINAPEDRIRDVMYEFKGRADLKIIKDSKDLLRTQPKSFEEIAPQCKELEKRIHDFQKDDLIQYLVKRRKIIDLVDKKLQLLEDGKFAYEVIIHDILFPQYNSSDYIGYEDHNLWLIDENLAYHQFAYSNKRICDISSSDSEKIPDIIVFDEKDDNDVAKSVSIIELKRPMRDNLDQSPIEQIYATIRDIQNKKIKGSITGRTIEIDENYTRFYAYAICDITKPVEDDLKGRDFWKLKGDLGYFGFNKAHNSYTQVLAYKQLIGSAKRKHKIFFMKLGIDI